MSYMSQVLLGICDAHIIISWMLLFVVLCYREKWMYILIINNGHTIHIYTNFNAQGVGHSDTLVSFFS